MSSENDSVQKELSEIANGIRQAREILNEIDLPFADITTCLEKLSNSLKVSKANRNSLQSKIESLADKDSAAETNEINSKDETIPTSDHSYDPVKKISDKANLLSVNKKWKRVNNLLIYRKMIMRNLEMLRNHQN
jgi:septal ring factor EnvC (AmiA/AmiB activator)